MSLSGFGQKMTLNTKQSRKLTRLVQLIGRTSPTSWETMQVQVVYTNRQSEAEPQRLYFPEGEEKGHGGQVAHMLP